MIAGRAGGASQIMAAVRRRKKKTPPIAGEKDGATLGLKWKDVGAKRPTEGKELQNDGLSKALLRQNMRGVLHYVFSIEEFKEFHVRGLQLNSFVRAGPSYYVPDETPEPEGLKPWFVRWTKNVFNVLNSLSLQACLYLVFVIVFQNLAGTMRRREEYYMTMHVMDKFVTTPFDSQHNTFETIRRASDIYEWGNQVLWPGFFGDAGPCNPFVGLPNTLQNKGCNDDAWPDGDGPHHLVGASPLGLDELVRRMDMLDWTEGILIKQGRAAPQNCAGLQQIGQCYPELERGIYTSSTQTYAPQPQSQSVPVWGNSAPTWNTPSVPQQQQVEQWPFSSQRR